MRPVSGRHLAVLVGICAIWGFNLVVIKAGVDRMPPIFFSLLRFVVLALAVAPFLRVRRGEMRWLLLASVCSGGLQFALMFLGISISSSMSAVAIAGQLGVPFMTLLSIAILGEQVGWRRWTGILLSFAGVMVIGFNPEVFDSLAGLALVVLGALSGSLGLVAIKRVHDIKPLELQAWFAWSSLPVLLLLTLLLEDGQLNSLASLDGVGVGAVLYTALVAGHGAGPAVQRVLLGAAAGRATRLADAGGRGDDARRRGDHRQARTAPGRYRDVTAVQRRVRMGTRRVRTAR
jgi:O-acetylserine/cysteine efflux transporter